MKTMNNPLPLRVYFGNSIARNLLLAASLGLATILPGWAASPSIWDGAGSANLWNDGTNWTGNVPVPGTAYDLQFAGTTKTLTSNNFTAASNFRNITFNLGAGPFVLTGNSTVLNGNVTNSGWSTQTINLDLNENGAVRTYSTGVLGTGTSSLIELGDLVIGGIISNGGLTKTSTTNGIAAGKLTLTGVNTYTGVTTITHGILSVATIGNGTVAGNLGAATNAAANLVFNGDGALQYTGASASTDRNFTINAGNTATFDITANNLTLAGASTVTTGILAKTGAGTLTLTRAMGNTGATWVMGGTLALDFTASGAPTSQILNSGSDLIFYSGGVYQSGTRSATLSIQGGSAANTQTFGALSVASAGSVSAHLNLLGGTASNPITVNFSSIAAFTGASNNAPTLDISKGANDVVNFTSSTGIFNVGGTFSGNSATVGITLNRTDWAALSGGTSGTVQAATYDSGVLTGNNVNVTASGTTSGGANTLRFNTATPITLTYSASVGVRGILVTPNVGTNDIVINSSSATTGFNNSNRDVVIFQNNTSGNLTISGMQNGSGAGNYSPLVKSGAGRLILSGTNNYSGATYVNEGALQISANSNIGGIVASVPASPQGFSLYLGATLEARGGTNITLDGQGTASGIYAHALVLGGGAPVIDVDAATTLTISGGINPTTNSFTVSGVLTKTGTGKLVLTGVNNSNGGLIVNGGTLQATFASAGVTVATATPQGLVWGNGTASNQVNFASGTTTINCLNAATAGVGGAPLAVGQLITGTGIAANTTITAVGAGSFTISQATTAVSTGSYNLYLNATTATFGNGTTSITVGNAAGIQIGQQISGLAGIAFGTVVTDVSGTTVTLNQATTAASGAGLYSFGGLNQYAVSSTNSLAMGYSTSVAGLSGVINGIQGNIVSDTNVNSGNYNVTNLVFGAADSLGYGAVTVNAGTLDLGGVVHQPLLGAVTITGGTIGNGTLQGTSYTGAVASGNATVSANLAGSSSVGLTKSGAGTLTLSGNNTYSGGTTVSVGTLQFANVSAMPASGTVIANSGGTLAINAGGTNEFTGATSGNGSIGGIFSGLGGQSGSTVTLASGSAVGIDTTNAGGSLTYAGNITNSGVSLTKLGTGILTLSGANTYTGDTTVSAGTLQIGGAGSLGSGSYAGAIANSGAFVYSSSANQTLSGIISGNGSLTKDTSSSSVLTLSTANTYSGTTTVSSGTLLINGSTSTSSTVTVASGATLGGNGTVGGFATVNGALNPGNSPGVLTFSNGLTLNGTTTMEIVGPTTPRTDFDQVKVTSGTTTFGGVLAFAFGPSLSLADNTNILLFSFAGTSLGNFSGVTSSGYYSGTWLIGVANDTWTLNQHGQLLTFSEVTGNLNVVPEPATWALLAFSLTTVMVLRRRRN